MNAAEHTPTSTQLLPRLLDKAEAANFLAVSVRTIDRLRAAGEIQSLTVGGRAVRIVASSIESYLERQLAGTRQAEDTQSGEDDPFAIPLLVELKTAAARRRAEKAEVAA